MLTPSVAQKREVESRALSFRSEEKRGVDFTVAFRPARKLRKGELELRKRTSGTGDIGTGVLNEKKRNTISVRLKEL